MDDVPNRPLTNDDKTEKQRGRFEPGQSGNPKGRPKGSRNRATLALEALLEGDADAILRKLIEKAKEGDSTALRLCLERLLPPRRDRFVAFDMDEIKSAADAVKATSSVLAAVADSTLSPDDGEKVMKLIESHIKMLEFAELEPQLRALQQQAEQMAHQKAQRS